MVFKGLYIRITFSIKYLFCHSRPHMDFVEGNFLPLLVKSNKGTGVSSSDSSADKSNG